MRRYLSCCGLLLLLVLPARAQETLPVKPKPRATLDLWDAVYLDGAKAGYQRTTIEEVERDGQVLYVTTQTLQLTVKRYESVVTQRMARGSEETKQGKVVGVSITQYLDRGQVTQRGRVEDGKLIVTTPTDPDGRAMPWNDKVIGLYGQETLFRRHKAKPGDKFHFLDYQLALLRPVTFRVEVKDREEIEVLETVKGDATRAQSVKKSLLRVELTPDRIPIGQNTLQLPRMTAWLDNDLRLVRMQSSIPGLADLMTMYRTTREVAEKGAAPEQMKDLGLKSFVRLDRALARPGEAREIIYRITAKDDDPASLFARDSRQSVENVEGHTFDLRVRGIREPAQGKNAAPPGKEYLESSYFLDSGNEKVQATAAKIVGDEEDPWRKAQRIERWVYDHMKPSNDVSPCPASEILQTRKGDCRQHAMLMAALCRATRIPARTAMGLVYASDKDNNPILAFHMWTEVWIKGQWLMLDAMQAVGGVGPTHLKIVDHSWQDIQTLAPLLPALRVIGQVKAEVVSVK